MTIVECITPGTADNRIVYYYYTLTHDRMSERKMKGDPPSPIHRRKKKRKRKTLESLPDAHLTFKKKRRIQIGLLSFFSSPVASPFFSFLTEEESRQVIIWGSDNPDDDDDDDDSDWSWIMMMMMTPFTRAHHTYNILTDLRNR